ncbi:HlyC/CorC family transporter [Roseospira visakhapatnamensis]|uniref:Mg2+/Co2+ transporter CorB n=1 Tax=Roseospira visakhapatnamensis TaxID=390880 RepID=A0A7W6W8Q6_9PROT|nr:HlyC/CorC family transporter [Roseospira visakhapatnamensis]MBB4264666.1 Mg2+/Co2+ transporter CorB [Roseospira visakhapatnamensis]
MIETLVAILFLLVLSGLFSGSETALTAASRPLMLELEKSGNSRARIVNTVLKTREQLIGTILLGNNLVNILASSLATSVMITAFGETGVVYATMVMTLLVLIFAEILPKTYALTHTNTMALAVAPIMRALTFVFWPVTRVIQGLVQVMLKLFKADAGQEKSAATALAELRGAIEFHTAEADGPGPSGQTVRRERAMLKSVLDLADVEVGEIMVHRSRLVMIDANLPASEIVEQVLNSAYTRIPLWRDRMDNIIGVLHVKALLRAVQAHTGSLDDLNVVSLAAPPWFIPDTTTLLHQLQAFRERREHFTLVVDEYGTIMGVVTLEDILEEIVGEISDEHDVQIQGVRPLGDGAFMVAGDVTIRDLNREFEWALPDDVANTLAGLILHEARRIPEQGQVFLFHGFRFEVVKRVRNRLTSIRVAPPAREPEAG